MDTINLKIIIYSTIPVFKNYFCSFQRLALGLEEGRDYVGHRTSFSECPSIPSTLTSLPPQREEGHAKWALLPKAHAPTHVAKDISTVYFLKLCLTLKSFEKIFDQFRRHRKLRKTNGKNKSYPKCYHSKDNYFRFHKGKDLAEFVHVCNPREATHNKCSVNIAKLNEKLNYFHPFEVNGIIHYHLFCNLFFV